MAKSTKTEEKRALGLTEKQADLVDFLFSDLRKLEKFLEAGTKKYLKDKHFPPKGKKANGKTFTDWLEFILSLNSIYEVTDTSNPSALASALDIKPPSVFNSLQRAKIPSSWVFTCVKKYKGDMEYLMATDFLDKSLDDFIAGRKKAKATDGKKLEEDPIFSDQKEAVSVDESDFNSKLKLIEKMDEDAYDLLTAKINRVFKKHYKSLGQTPRSGTR